MKKLFFFSILAMLSLTMNAQRFDWVRGWSGYGGSSDSEVPGNVIKGSVVDSEGNIYVVGEYFPGTKVFGVDPVPLDIATATTNRSIVVAKLDKEGELVWYKGIYNSLANGGMGNQYVRDIRLVGDTAVMIMANILMPGNNPGDNISGNILYYLDTLLIDWTYMPWNDSINERKATVFIELGLDGAFMEDHFLYIGALDSAGNPFVVSSGKVELDPLNSHFFDVDNDGNIYITRYNEGSFHIPGLCTDSTGRFPVPFTVTNGGVSKLRVIADGRGDMFFTPPHKAAEWNLNVMKFSPHFERLINSVYVFDSTDVYSESNIFFHPSTGVAYKPGIHASSFKIDERNNVYMLLCLHDYSSLMPLSNSDTLAFTGHDEETYTNLLIKYDSSLTPLFAKQLRSTYGTDDPYQSSRRFETGTIEVASETNTIYLTGELQKNYLGMADNGTVQIYFDSDTLDLKNNFYWLRLDRDNGSLVSYGKVQSDYMAEIYTDNSSVPTIAVANGKVAATFNYTYNFTFADTTISSGTSYNNAQAMAIWDDMGNEIACYDFNAIHSRNRTGGVYVHDSTLYVTGVVYTGATFGDTVLASTGGRSQAFIAKYVNPIFAQSGSSERLPQHITWEQELDFIAQPSPIALNAYASSGLPIHYTSSDPDVAYIDGGNLFYAGEGDATVTATQPGNYIYLAAEPVTKPVITPSGHNPGGDGIQQAADGRQQAAVSVYPNPTSGVVHIDTDGAAITTVALHNAMGQTVATDTIKQSNNHTTIDLSPLPAGVYYLTVRSGETTARHKIIKVAK